MSQRFVSQWGFSNGVLKGYAYREQNRALAVLPKAGEYISYNMTVMSKVNAALHEMFDLHICADSYHPQNVGEIRTQERLLSYYGFFAPILYGLDGYPTSKQTSTLYENEKLVLAMLFDCLQAYPQLLLNYSIQDRGKNAIAAYQPITKKVFKDEEIAPLQKLNER